MVAGLDLKNYEYFHFKGKSAEMVVGLRGD